MEIVIIVEGKRDKARLKRVLTDEVLILCTLGTPGTDQLETLKKQAGSLPIYLFTDNDSSGKRIRYLLRELFPEAEQIYTRRGYAGVEGTPEEYLIQQLEKAGLDEFIVYPSPAIP
ncbi:DNA primase [Paenibacillus psychroresistens]|uniref:DNA primase n=1 Tax=Paenibacillus psychroresistens TaxID=1778678 RepID=A0A6B8RX61_9BACL|nr:toprim domain-containing protein [Paenibacillus psychroresistens]QGQ99608.1 DNA primase [Paenibacillus psychroresistens]